MVEKEKIVKESRNLYADIDNCITELLKARTEHNSDNEGKALFRMEGLMVATLQHLACIVENLKDPEVDLEKEIEKMWNVFIETEAGRGIFSDIAHYFYELGRLNARKEK